MPEDANVGVGGIRGGLAFLGGNSMRREIAEIKMMYISWDGGWRPYITIYS